MNRRYTRSSWSEREIGPLPPDDERPLADSLGLRRITPVPLAVGGGLGGLLLGALYALPLLHVAANRLVVGEPVYASAIPGPAMGLASALMVGALMTLVGTRRRSGALAALFLLAAAWAILGTGLGAEAARLIAGRPPAVRVGLGSGVWIVSAGLAAGLGWSVRRARRRGLGLLTVLAGLAFLTLAGRAGVFDGLSLAVEYARRRDAVNGAVLEHLRISGSAVIVGIAGSIALSLWRTRQGAVGLLVGGIQVVPAVALLGGLVALASGLLRVVPALRDLGFSALGPGPAVIGIAAYLLLPLWRGIGTALSSPDPAILDAAIALGLTRGQMLAQIRLPLGAPVLIGALRVAVVQSLGLATLGALIGAGGLGRIVFDGMAQFAPDLTLLGAVPIVALSLGAERCLSFAEAWSRTRWHA